MVKISYSILFFFLFVSCRSWYVSDCGTVAPKNPKFRLKDAFTFEESKLDTAHVYRLIGYFDKQNREVPTKTLDDIKFYTKFYSGGKFSTFSIPKKDILKATDLNPSCHGKGFYIFLNNGDQLKTETFAVGSGDGFYLVKEYLIRSDGDTLISLSNNLYHEILVKEKVPEKWDKYHIAW